MKLFNRLLLLTILCFILGGCTDDEVETLHTNTGLVVSLALPDDKTVDINTRSASVDVISDVLIVMLKNGKVKYQSFVNQPGSSLTITKFTPKVGDAVYVFCNTGKTSVDTNADTEDKLLESITASNASADLMYSKSTSIYDGGQNEMKLEHSLAKICLYSKTSGVDVASWKICNVPDKGFMSGKNDYPSGTQFTDVIEAGTDSCAFIIPRHDNSSVTPKTYLLLQLQGKGWYRMDFCDGSQELDFAAIPTFMNIERNYRYRFNILSVKNDGYQTEQLAADNPGSNIVYRMEIVDGSSLSNGQYSLVTNKDKIELPSLSFTEQNVMDISVKIPDNLKSIVSIPYSVTLHNPNGLELVIDTKTGNEINLLDIVGNDITRNIRLALKVASEGTFNLEHTYIEVKLGNLVKQIPISLQTANCYIHNFQDDKPLFIPLEQANKGDKVRIDPSKVPELKIIWSDVPINSNDFNLTFESNSKSIKIEGTGRFVGNFVVAAIVDMEIKWSWHVWCMDNTSVEFNDLSGSYELINNQKFGNLEWMDRNLGATTATIDATSSQGLLYQWGRKDPFPSSEQLNNEQEPTIYHGTTGYNLQESHPLYGTCAISLDANDNIEYAIAHPTQFIKGNRYEWKTDDITYVDMHWATNAYNEKFDYLWTDFNGDKTIYDPCPVGWRVAKNGQVGPWSSLKFEDAIITNQGASWEEVYFPSTTTRIADAKLQPNATAIIWCGELFFKRANYCCTLINKDMLKYIGFMPKAYGMPVRCIKDN